MVKNSLNDLLDKFPYFLNKSKDSNFYKVQWVNNENFKDLYNSLFKVYESFHLTKKLLVWKEQDKPYDYRINFVANYPNLKSVKIYKNDNLIYLKEYLEEDEADYFNFTYTCDYLKTVLYDAKAFYCNNCGEIILGLHEPNYCSNCEETDFTELNIYKCDNCGEIYFSQNIPDTCTYCNTSNFREMYACKCDNCGQVYFEEHVPEVCSTCGVEKLIDTDSVIYYTDEDVILHDNSMSFDEETITEDSTIEPVIVNIEAEEENESFDNPADGVEETVRENEVLKIPVPIITDDKFIITVETYDEYVLSKGFPENDILYDEYKNNPVDDVYNHDWSLDEFGILNNIPRKTYIDVTNPELYNLTEPPYNKRDTEDDYHYMNRILEYNLRSYATLHLNELKDYTTENIKALYYKYKDYYSKIGIKDYNAFNYYIDNPHLFEQHYNPISLEIWKLYGLDSTLLNRERLLLKMFDITKHEYDEETGLVECWQPMEWEHKDRFCDGSASLGEYFLVEADTIRPTIYQNVKITFKLLNSLAEEITDDYLVDIYYYREGETCPNTPIRSDYDSSTAMISYELFEDNPDSTHILRFVAHKTDGTIIGSEELLFKVRNCDDGDWYVSPTGNDLTGDGSQDKPFRTLGKALSVVNNALDLIVVSGDLTLSDESSVPIVNTNCTILGCDDVSITNTYSNSFFHLVGEKGISLHLVNLILKYEELVSEIKITDYINKNKDFYDFETVLINGGVTALTATINNNEYYQYDNILLEGSLKSKEGVSIPGKKLIVKIEDTTLGTILTDSNGEFRKYLRINTDYTSDPLTVYVILDDVNYFKSTQELQFNIREPNKIRVKLGNSIRLTSVDREEDEVVNYYYPTDDLVGSATVDSNGNATLTLTPTWGTYIIYTYREEDNSLLLQDEWVVETYINIDSLSTNEFITSVSFNQDGSFNYTTKTISKVADITGLITDITFYDDLRYDVTTFTLDTSNYTEDVLNSGELTPYEYNVLKEAIIDITVDDNGDVKLHRIGD